MYVVGFAETVVELLKVIHLSSSHLFPKSLLRAYMPLSILDARKAVMNTQLILQEVQENHYRMSEMGNCRDLGNTKEDHLTYIQIGVVEECQGGETSFQQANRRGGMWNSGTVKKRE